MLTPHNILRHELSGLRVRIVEAKDPGHKIAGIVVGETRETLRIKTASGIKTLPKKHIRLEAELPDKSVVEIEGSLLVARPEDRVKKKHRIRFNR